MNEKQIFRKSMEKIKFQVNNFDKLSVENNKKENKYLYSLKYKKQERIVKNN